MSHHAGVIVGLLCGVDKVKLGQVSREGLRAVYQHLLETCQVLEDTEKDKMDTIKPGCSVQTMTTALKV